MATTNGVQTVAPGTAAPVGPYLRAWQKDPKTGKYRLVWMKTAGMSDAQIKKLRDSRLNQPGAPKPGTKAPTPETVTTPAAQPGDAWKTDPEYIKNTAGLRYDKSLSDNQYTKLMGDGTSRGRIHEDLSNALDALGFQSRKAVSNANAGISGANLAGSGIARRTLSDIESERQQNLRNLQTGASRDSEDEQARYNEANTRFGSLMGAEDRLAAEAWSAMNGAPASPTAKPAAKPAASTTKPKAPSVKAPGIPTQSTSISKFQASQTKPVGTVRRPGQTPITNTINKQNKGKTFTDKSGNVRRVGTGAIVRAAR